MIRLSAGLLVLLLATALIRLPPWWYQWKQQHGISRLEWQDLSISFTALQVRRLALFRQGSGAQPGLEARNLRLELAWPTGYRLQLAGLDLHWPPPAAGPGPGLQLSETLLPGYWLGLTPRQASLEQVRISLPCPQGLCQLQGRLDWQREPDTGQARLGLSLPHNSHQLDLQLVLVPETGRIRLDGQLWLDQQLRLESGQWFSLEQGQLHWSGGLAVARLPEAAWLAGWLQEWLGSPLQTLSGASRDLQLGAGWTLQAPLGQPEALQGELQLALDWPDYWPVPGLGQLRGKLETRLTARQGLWLPGQLEAALHLVPQGRWLDSLPAALQPARLTLEVHQQPPAPDGALAFNLQLAGNGPGLLRLQAPRITASPVSMRLDSGPLQLDWQIPELRLPWLEGQNLQVHLELEGQLDARQLQLDSQPGSRLSARQLASPALPGLKLSGLQAGLDGLQLRQGRLTGPLRLEIHRLQHPQLKPQAWQWQGRLAFSPDHRQLDGQLDNASGLRLQQRWQQPAGQAGQLRLTLAPLDFARSNPLANTLQRWPAPLQLNQGQLEARAAAGLPTGPARLVLQLENLGGQYGQTRLQGLSGDLLLDLQANQPLQLALHRLRLEQLSPGLPLGPLTLQAHYLADRQQPARGQLQLASARLDLLDGRLEVRPGQYRIASDTIIPCTLQGLDLARLLQAYPADGLQGSGLLDGHFQITGLPEAPRIDQGQLAARGTGLLRIHPPRLAAMARDNPAMALVSQALEDFHYDRLSGGFQYDTRGQLQLALQLHGRNPALQEGRPINVNIRLEENLPRLLTSLQLSDRVSEKIRQRVNDQLQSAP